jgi:hypothetical protein
MTAEPPPAETTVLHGRSRLSESPIWALQRAFYEAQGRDAWKPKGVPFWMTSNAFFARAMARMVLAFLRDLVAGSGEDALHRAGPLNVLELAAGSGQFAFSFLRSLRKLKLGVPGLERVRVRYVMTDLAESNVDAWRSHERLRPLVEEGLLDFALFDIEHDGDVRLRESGEALAGSANPLVVLANYAFDSTRQDCFRVDGHTLAQDLVTTLVAGSEPAELSDPGVMARIRLRFEPAPMDAAYYDDPASNRVLEGYRQRLGTTTFLFPVGALDCLRRLLRTAGQRLFLLCADKGSAAEEELKTRGDPVMTLHGNCFSFVLNLNAIGRYFEETGGVALHGSHHAPGLQVSGFVAGFPAEGLAETRQAFQAEVDGFGPGEFFTLVKGIMKDLSSPSLDVVLALLRLCEDDPEVLYVYSDVLREHARNASPAQKREILRAMRQTWEGFYPLHKDLAFDLARLAIALGAAADARAYCEHSLRLFGRTHAILLMLAYSHCLEGRYAEGLRVLEDALALDPDSPAALDLRARLQRAPGGP